MEDKERVRAQMLAQNEQLAADLDRSEVEAREVEARRKLKSFDAARADRHVAITLQIAGAPRLYRGHYAGPGDPGPGVIFAGYAPTLAGAVGDAIARLVAELPRLLSQVENFEQNYRGPTCAECGARLPDGRPHGCLPAADGKGAADV